jgi:transposase
MGFRSLVSRSTLADANEVRDWRIYADFAQLLITRARDLYVDQDIGIEFSNTVYALDSTTIDLCFSLFPWATYKSDQHAVKLHTVLDLRGKIPTFIRITPAQLHDVLFLDHLILEPGAFYVMDRGYLDFARLRRWNLANAFFVTRARKNLRYKRLISHEVDKTTGVQCDQTILLKWFYSVKGYPDRLRRVRFLDPQSQKRLVFLTNNFTLPAQTIADLYRNRWHVELFFKWIKQHLRIKAFVGTSPNALKTQIWTAMCAYVLVAIVKKRLNLDLSLYTILQILSVSLFEKKPILRAFSDPPRHIVEDVDHNQLQLFNI